MSKTRLAIFDCDGTLVDGQHNHCMAMEAAFVGAGLAPVHSNVSRQVIGLSLPESMRILAPGEGEGVHRQMVDAYKSAFLSMRQNGEVDEPLYAGIAPLLASLDTDGWLLGVATGKSDRGLERCLETHGIRDLFVTLQTADRHPSKPHPSMALQAMHDTGIAAQNAVVIGDTVYDIEMGSSSGCRTIGVGWGYHRLDELDKAGATHIAESVEELGAILKEMI